MPVSRRLFVAASAAAVALPSRAQPTTQSWPLDTPRRAGIHDVAPAPDGGVWFTAQASGHLGWFDPKTGKSELVPLGRGSAPHAVVQGPDKSAWLTDGGQNAIVRVAWPSREVKVFPLPASAPSANLNTCAFDGEGDLWFTGQAGYVGKLAVKTGGVTVKNAPRGRGPYGICTTPSGDVWWCSLAGSFIARLDLKTGESTIVEPPTRNQGARRIWSDSRGRLWVSEWLAGQLAVHDPKSGEWRQWKLPGAQPMTYAVFVDDRDIVWVSDFGADAVLSFDPRSEKFNAYKFPRSGIAVREIQGRPGEVWLPESGTDHISVIRTA